MFDLHEDASAKGIPRLSILQLHVLLSTRRDTFGRPLDTMKAAHVKSYPEQKGRAVSKGRWVGTEVAAWY
jgi:hypothetical protein